MCQERLKSARKYLHIACTTYRQDLMFYRMLLMYILLHPDLGCYVNDFNLINFILLNANLKLLNINLMLKNTNFKLLNL